MWMLLENDMQREASPHQVFPCLISHHLNLDILICSVTKENFREKIIIPDLQEEIQMELNSKCSFRIKLALTKAFCLYFLLRRKVRDW
jgi:hypothetical protein